MELNGIYIPPISLIREEKRIMEDRKSRMTAELSH
jgi:hypothetical protein